MLSRRGKPTTRRGRPMSRRGRPISRRGRPTSRRGRPGSRRGRPTSRRGRPGTRRGRPMSRRGRPITRHLTITRTRSTHSIAKSVLTVHGTGRRFFRRKRRRIRHDAQLQSLLSVAMRGTTKPNLAWLGEAWQGEETMYKVEAEIRGVSPLFQNRFGVEAANDIEGVIKGRKRDDRPPEEIAKGKLYLNGNNICCHPGDAIRSALADGGGDLRKVKTSTWKKDLKGSVQIMPPMIPIQPQKWTVDSRRAVNPNTRGAVIAHRPRFDEWSLAFELIVTNDEIPIQVVKEALARGGIRIGIGDARVIGYGRFNVVKFEKK